MSSPLARLLFLLNAFFLLTVFYCPFVFSQKDEPQRIINTIPSKVPIKVEITNGGMKSALEDIEIKITNIGKKPIYYLGMSISSEREFAPRNYVGFSSFQIGNVQLSNFSRSFGSLIAERAETKPFEPGDTTVFKIEKKQAEMAWKLMMDYGYPKDAKLKVYISLLRFGDGTGYMTPEAVEMPDPEPVK